MFVLYEQTANTNIMKRDNLLPLTTRHNVFNFRETSAKSSTGSRSNHGGGEEMQTSQGRKKKKERTNDRQKEQRF